MGGGVVDGNTLIREHLGKTRVKTKVSLDMDPLLNIQICGTSLAVPLDEGLVVSAGEGRITTGRRAWSGRLRAVGNPRTTEKKVTIV